MRVFSWLLLVCLLALPIAAAVGPAKDDPGPSPWTVQPFNNAPGLFNFAIVADVNGGERAGVFASAVEKLNLLQPAFVMCVGDHIPGYETDVAELTREYDSFDQRLAKLQMAFHRVPGNHDITNDTELKLYQQRYGRPYSSFIYNDVLFLCVDSEDPPRGGDGGQMSDEQVAYFQQTLAEKRLVRWTMVFMHEPLWRNDKSNWDKMEKALGDRPYTVFAGHDHVYNKTQRNGHDYYILSVTGGGIGSNNPLTGQFDHLMWVTMRDNGPVIANLTLDGILPDNVYNEEMGKALAPYFDGTAVQCAPFLVKKDTVTEATTQLRITNDGDKPLRFSGSLSIEGAAKVSPENLVIEVPAKSVRTRDLRLTCKPAQQRGKIEVAQLSYSLNVTLPDGRLVPLKDLALPIPTVKKLEVQDCPQVRKAVTVDGNLQEWGKFPYADSISTMSDETFDGAFRFATAHDAQYLYVAVAVTDSAVITMPDKYPWEQDGIEIRVNAEPDQARAQWRGSWGVDDPRELLVTLSPAVTAADTISANKKNLPAGLQAVCVKNATGYTAEVAIPVSYLDAQQKTPWQTVRLNINTDNKNLDGTGYQLWWMGDWRSVFTYNDAGAFRKR